MGNVYSQKAICDICSKEIDAKIFMFHCPKEKSIEHNGGYDICLQCAIGNKQTLLKYESNINSEMLALFANKSKQKSMKCVSTIPYLMNVQIETFEKIKNQINGMNEAPDPGLDEKENEQLSLSRLYSMRRALNQSILKQESLSKAVDGLLECIDCKVNDIESDWEQWNAQNIIDWICNLENRKFVKYKDILMNEFNDGSATGEILPDLNIAAWNHMVHNWAVAKALNQHKNELIRKKKDKLLQIHHYPCPYAEDEEGAQTKHVSHSNDSNN